jgi:hypothetical protein
MRREENNVSRRVMNMYVEGWMVFLSILVIVTLSKDGLTV